MILEAYELSIIKTRQPDRVKNFLIFLNLDVSFVEYDDLTLAETIDEAIKKQINATYAELWREVLELSESIGLRQPKPNTQTIKFLLDNKAALLSSAKTIHGLTLLAPLGSLLLVPTISHCETGITNDLNSVILFALAIVLLTVGSLYLARKVRKQKNVQSINNQNELNIKRFIEILEEVYKLRLVLES